MSRASNRAFKAQLNRIYAWYTGGFLVFVLLLAACEQMGLSRRWIGFIFLAATVLLYAGIGVMSRTSEASEYYVAGRRVPALYNGMATAADWMSAASFIGMAGALYHTGYAGLAFIMGWTGGFCLVALLLAPYLRRFGQFTIPDFLAERYGGQSVRLVAIVAAILCSFTYVVAQIYGVGLITTRLTGLAFEIGVFVGLGGILVCSFLGGMRAVTWTQVAQYIVLTLAYIVPVVWLSIQQVGHPVPQIGYGQQLQRVSELERRLIDDPKEREVIAILQRRVADYDAKLRDVPAALVAERLALQARVERLKQERAPLAQIQAATRELARLPVGEAAARTAWIQARNEAAAAARPLAGMPPHAMQFPGDPDAADPAERARFDDARRNFLALVLCLMLGTASLPHILMRYYTTPSVKEARESVTWSLLFILFLYLTAPALAVLVKYEIFTAVVGLPFDRLPQWITDWSRVDASLLAVSDINHDGLLQLGELRISADIVVLATPAIAGMPFVVSGMVAAGGLAAALSTADGLLLTIANALSHDLYYKMIDPNASTARRVAISKALLLIVALAAAAVAAQKPADIVFQVSTAFSFAASAFFPALVLGIFWRRANAWGAVAGMVVGLGVTVYYMATSHPWLRQWLHVTTPVQLWWGIQPISAGIFGVAAGFATIAAVSLATPAPPPRCVALAEGIRYPAGPGLP